MLSSLIKWVQSIRISSIFSTSIRPQSSDAGLHVVAGEESGDAVHDPLPPAVVVLLQHVDDGALLERELVLLVRVVVVYRHNYKNSTNI